MPSRDDWIAVIEIVARTGDCSSAEIPKLYEMATRDGESLLTRRFRAVVPKEERRDLIHDVLAKTLEAVLAAENPRAYFIACVTNAAIDRIRRTEARPAELRPEGRASGVEEPDREFVLDARRALSALSPRDARIVVAAAEGVDVREIAKAVGTTVDNVYTVVSRARRRWRAEAGK